MGLVDAVYRNVFRRTSTFLVACLGGAFMFERGFDFTANYIFETRNQGKLWKHIKGRYADAPAEEE